MLFFIQLFALLSVLCCESLQSQGPLLLFCHVFVHQGRQLPILSYWGKSSLVVVWWVLVMRWRLVIAVRTSLVSRMIILWWVLRWVLVIARWRRSSLIVVIVHRMVTWEVLRVLLHGVGCSLERLWARVRAARVWRELRIHR